MDKGEMGKVKDKKRRNENLIKRRKGEMNKERESRNKWRKRKGRGEE